MNFISDKNLDYKGICEVENTNLSYASMAFLIALVKGMSMINLKHPSAKGENNHIFTYSNSKSILHLFLCFIPQCGQYTSR